MKSFLITSLLLISTAAFVSGQEKTVGIKQKAVGKTNTHLRPAIVTRAQMREAERRLSEMGYWTGAVDGRIDKATKSALVAFQKYEGRSVSERLTLDELEAIRVAKPPQARESGYAHIEVDIDRQVLLIVNDDSTVRSTSNIDRQRQGVSR